MTTTITPEALERAINAGTAAYETHVGEGRSAMVKAIVLAALPELQAAPAAAGVPLSLDFDTFRRANVARCEKWHPDGIASWSPSDWLTAAMGELGELASEVKMHNRVRDGLAGNKEQVSPDERTRRMANEAADVVTYLDLFCAERGIDLGAAVARKFNEVSERVGFPDRILIEAKPAAQPQAEQRGAFANEREVFAEWHRRKGCSQQVIDDCLTGSISMPALAADLVQMALAARQPVGEPVGEVFWDNETGKISVNWLNGDLPPGIGTLLYDAPPAAADMTGFRVALSTACTLLSGSYPETAKKLREVSALIDSQHRQQESGDG